MKKQLLIVCLFTLFGASSAFANTQGRHELSHAIMQAKMGTKDMSLQKVDTQLHRITNCLVGHHGVSFDAKAGDPCMGKGAMNDFKNGRFSTDEMQQALEDAHYGLMTKHAKIARNAADLAYESLQKAKAGD